MLPILLLLVIFFTKPSLATTTVTLTSVPSSITIGETFPISFNIDTTSTSPSFHYKIVGTGVTLFTQPNESCSGAYDSCPEVSIGTSGLASAIAYAKISVITGPISVLVRVAESVSHAASSSSSQIISNYIVPTATITPSPIPTYIPTNTPVPTTAPTSTSIPTIVPTIKPTITPTPTPEPPLTPINDPLPPQLEDLPSSTLTPIPEISPIITSKPSSTTSSNYLPTIFICSGGLLLLIPLVISKLKK